MSQDNSASNVVKFQDFAVANTASTLSAVQKPYSTFVPNDASSIILDKPEWEPPVVGKLKNLLELEEGWDGFDAKRPDFSTALFGLRLLHHLLPLSCRAPQLSPTNYGGLQFEWYLDHGQFEIEIESSFNVRAWFKDYSTEEEIEQAFDYEFSDLKLLVHKALSFGIEVPHAASAA